MGWVSASEYDLARPDPLADAAEGIIQHMNSDHRHALMLIAQVFGGMGSQEAAMTSIDRLGFHVRLKTADGMRGVRIAFPHEVASSAETRTVLVEMTQQARHAESRSLPQ
jgi:heme iron utilization protein